MISKVSQVMVLTVSLERYFFVIGAERFMKHNLHSVRPE